MAHLNYGQGQEPEPPQQWKASPYAFTEPIRYFKSNDPYYWQVDNIPIKQLEQNILWLRDQVNLNTSSQSTSRKNFDELRPFATGADFKVSIQPGRYTSRINDAYNKGFISANTLGTPTAGEAPSDLRFGVPSSFHTRLFGSSQGGPIFSNGLYDRVHHHMCHDGGGFVVSWSPNFIEFEQNLKSGINNIPGVKHALIKKIAAGGGFDRFRGFGGGPTIPDLQTLASYFVNYWSGVARTSIVNVPETLTIDVPQFNEEDFLNDSQFQPAYRIDLLFVYSHPIDASSTAIARDSGGAPATINAPQLGILKGAGAVGVVAKNLQPGADLEVDGLSSISYLETDEFTLDDTFTHFEFTDTKDAQYGYDSIAAPVVDQIQNVAGMEGIYGSFPSPDDLLNIAPLLQEGLEKNNLALVGQTVLPVAYVVVRRGAQFISTEDVIDIRPFFRTAELAYNERSGIAAANPPLSMANPAVGKTELGNSMTKLKEEIVSLIPGEFSESQRPRVVGSGFIFGGLRYGVEGALLRLAAARPNSPIASNVTNPTARFNFLRDMGHLPFNSSEGTLRDLPDWEIAPWAASKTNPGSQRNDRTWVSRVGAGSFSLPNDSSVASFHDLIDYAGAYSREETGYAMSFCRKKVEIDVTNVPWMQHYDVILEYVNCMPATDIEQWHPGGDADIYYPRQFTGLSVSKEGNSFTIISAFTSFMQSRNQTNPGPYHPWGTNNTKQLLSVGSDTYRSNGPAFANFAVHHSMLDYNRSDLYTADGSADSPSLPVVPCTYPTVKYTIIGYPTAWSPNITGGDTVILQ